MERLSDTAIEIINELHTERLDYSSEYIPLIDAANRLAAYEDLMDRWKLRSIEEADRIFHRVNALGGTDLMAQYRDIGSIDHLRDLTKAEQDGRLVVLDEPMRPLVWGDKEHDTILCPRCLCDLMGGFEYAPSCETVMFQCPHCGQPINSGKAIDMEQSEAEAALKGGEG